MGVIVMYDVIDIVNHIILQANNNETPITNLLLQKILYYLNAEHLVRKGERLFSDKIEKWGYGPVIPVVYTEFKSKGAGLIDKPIDVLVDEKNHRDTDDKLFGSVYVRRFNDEVFTNEVDPKDLESINEITKKLLDAYSRNPFNLVGITHKEPMWANYEDKIKDHLNLAYSDEELNEYFGNGNEWPWD